MDLTEMRFEITRRAAIEGRRIEQQLEDECAAFLLVTGLDPSECVIEWGPYDFAAGRLPYRIYANAAPRPIASA
jgi:hypothetical protein